MTPFVCRCTGRIEAGINAYPVQIGLSFQPEVGNGRRAINAVFRMGVATNRLGDHRPGDILFGFPFATFAFYMTTFTTSVLNAGPCDAIDASLFDVDSQEVLHAESSASDPGEILLNGAFSPMFLDSSKVGDEDWYSIDFGYRRVLCWRERVCSFCREIEEVMEVLEMDRTNPYPFD